MKNLEKTLMYTLTIILTLSDFKTPGGNANSLQVLLETCWKLVCKQSQASCGRPEPSSLGPGRCWGAKGRNQNLHPEARFRGDAELLCWGCIFTHCCIAGTWDPPPHTASEIFSPGSQRAVALISVRLERPREQPVCFAHCRPCGLGRSFSRP